MALSFILVFMGALLVQFFLACYIPSYVSRRYNHTRYMLEYLREAANRNMPFTDVLNAVHDDTSGLFSYFVNEIRKDIEDGVPPGKAFSKYRSYFPPVIRNMFISNDIYGGLKKHSRLSTGVFSNISRMVEDVSSKMLIPLAVAGLQLYFIVLMFVFILPKFLEMFVEMQLDASRLLYLFFLGYHLSWAYLMFILAVVFFLLFGLLPLRILYYWVPGAGRLYDTLVLWIPFVGKRVAEYNLAQALTLTGVMLEGGETLEDAFEGVQELDINRRIKREFARAAEKMRQGENLAQCVDEMACLPRVTRAGLKALAGSPGAGQLVMSQALRFQQRLSGMIDYLSQLAYPVFIIPFGLIVFLMSASVFSALVDLIYRM